ncbi:hypothetical protein [Streptomyces sp. NPDC050738]|uniref:DUF7674 family protein n=1 Tax=Streptomyces sp. NPDC050738 TaxID=3154744 RepID=UPI00342EEE58
MGASFKKANAVRLRALEQHAAARWPEIAELSILARGEVVRLSVSWTGEERERPGKLCRLRETAHPDFWTFALYSYAEKSYRPSALPSGAWTGSPEEILDHACERHLGAYIPPARLPDAELAHDAVVHALVDAVPELYEDLLLHLYNEHEVLTHVFFALDVTPFVINAWREGRSELTARCLEFLERAMTCDDPDTRSVVGTSFVYQVGPWDPRMAAFIRTWPPALLRNADLQAPEAGLRVQRS